MVRKSLALAGAALIALSSTAATSASARQDDTISSYEVAATLDDSGTLDYQATITFDQDTPDSFTIRLTDELDAPDDITQRFTISDIVVGGAASAVTEIDGGFSIAIEPDGDQPIVLGYTVVGTTLTGQADTTVFEWAAVQGVSLPITVATGTVQPPAPANDYRCQSGPVDNLSTCGWFSGGTEHGPGLSFEVQNLAAGEIVRPAMTFAPGQVPVTEILVPQWRLDRAFGLAPANLLVALLAGVLGTVLLIHRLRRLGGDAAPGEPVTLARFVPVGAGESVFEAGETVRPGMIGTLADEHVDPVDITATILDLAVRGHLRITELPVTDAHAPLDWRLTRRSGADPLAPYEQTLLDAIPEAGLLVSEVGTLQGAVGQLQSDLYDEVVARGWFTLRPDAVRQRSARLGWVVLGVAVVVLGLLVAFTSFGVLGLVLVGLAGGLLALGDQMPARTTLGSSVLVGLDGLASQLRLHPTDEMPAAGRYRELSRLLPYAVVLGSADRWLQAVVAADDDQTPDPHDLDWFHAPDDWHLDRLPESLDALLTSIQGRLVRR